MFPEIDPYRWGHADVGDGHEIYWEECGNPSGKPVLILHGGPGSGCTANNRRFYDPHTFRIVLFDQRNCGRSRPHASEPNVDLTANTTALLIKDIEVLRDLLGIECWLLQGASWGSVLALAYAEAFPERVSELILISMGTGRRAETDLLTAGLGRMFHVARKRLTEFAEAAGSEGTILDRYHRLLFDQDPEVRACAASEWVAWETAILPTAPGPSPRFDSPEYRLAFARLVTHYWRHGSWLREGELLEGAHRIAEIPGVILQGRLDLGNLSGSPWELAARWPSGTLEFIEDAGHEGSRTFNDALLEWTARFANM